MPHRIVMAFFGNALLQKLPFKIGWIAAAPILIRLREVGPARTTASVIAP
jgi:hypothetical protein